MNQGSSVFVAIDLKSFYASVECIERGLNPLTTNLVVADNSRTEKTICLAVSPSLKACGISGRPRLFEVSQRVKEINAKRLRAIPDSAFLGSSKDIEVLKIRPEFALDYIVATPRMACYIEYSTRIYNIYLKYVAPEDIHVYSIDEVFIDVTHYLSAYRMSGKELVKRMIKDVYRITGITATAGMGTNLYLCKVAMDIVAKHIHEDDDGVRIAELDEKKYRELLWEHQPITDFWRVGKGYAKKLEEIGLKTMGDIALCSLGKKTDFHNEDLLYKIFGVNAELLIDHAWGWEPVRLQDIKTYQPEASSMGTGQVLHCPYKFDKAKLIVREMIDNLVLELVEKDLVTDQIVLTVGYDIENLSSNNQERQEEITVDYYGRKVPKAAHGSVKLKQPTSSTAIITEAAMNLYDRIVKRNLFIRRINVTAAHVFDEKKVMVKEEVEQLDLFHTPRVESKKRQKKDSSKEKEVQKAILKIKKRYGKNAVLKGMNLEEGATTKERNKQIGGHKA